MTREDAQAIVAEAAGNWANEIREWITDIDDSVADEIDAALEMLAPWTADPLHEQIGDDPRA